MEIQSKEIYEYLDMKGIKHANSGYRYLVKAIEIGLENPIEVKKITNLYNIVGDKFNISNTCVERAIRYALKTTSLSNKEFVMFAIDKINGSSNSIQNNYSQRLQPSTYNKVKLQHQFPDMRA